MSPRNVLLAFTTFLTTACHGQEDPAGLDEPIRVIDGVFHEGDLPGSPPLTDAEVAGGAVPERAFVTIIDSLGSILLPGQLQKSLNGRATDDASAVGIRLEGAGTGYWTVPLGAPDPAVAGELTWRIAFDVGHDVAPGLRRLLFAAIDESGRAGTQVAMPVCVRPTLPDNLHACDPSRPLPAAVVGIEWDAPVDLDLRVITPEGKIVDPKHPTTAPLDEMGKLAPRPGDGTFDRDGFQGCEIGPKREHLVFQDKPLPGVYYVFASLFDACGAPAVRFDTTLHLAQGEPAVQAEAFRVSGQLLAEQADGGATFGLFVAEFAIQ